MKALKFLAKALIAALGVCVIVGALNYSGFSFSDLKWNGLVKMRWYKISYRTNWKIIIMKESPNTINFTP